jgi:hypothetical protein
MGVITRVSSTSGFEVKVESLAAAVKLVRLICGLAGLASNLLHWNKMIMLGFNQEDIIWICYMEEQCCNLVYLPGFAGKSY